MMKQTDYAGLHHLRDYLRDFEDDYVVIGGFATLMLLDRELEGHGKATFDIDLVLLTSNNSYMTQKIKAYVKEGQYEIQKGARDQYTYYRFIKPHIEGFAKEIELFASNKNDLSLDPDQRIIPIDAEEGLYSLSAIMLDPEYFEMIKQNVEKSTIAPCTNTQATIMLKMSAFRDLKERNDDKYKKHRRDIFKLSFLLTGEEKISLLGRMKEDFDAFIEHVETQLDAKAFKSITYPLIIDKVEMVATLKKVYIND